MNVPEVVQHPQRRYGAALLTLGAAAIHFTVAPGHLSEYLPYGIFFFCLRVAQTALAVALVVRPSRRLYAIALVGTLAVIAIWLMSRSTGLPIAPVPWRAETIAFPDFAATLLEAISCVMFALRLRRRPARRRGRFRVALTTLPALLFSSQSARRASPSERARIGGPSVGPRRYGAPGQSPPSSSCSFSPD